MKTARLVGQKVVLRLKQLFNLRVWSRKLIIARILIVIALLVLVLLFARGVNKQSPPPAPQPEEATSVHDSRIRELEKTNNIDELRSLEASYSSQKNYTKALEVAKRIAAQTQAKEDIFNVLRICAVYDVPEKLKCAQEVAPKLRNSVSQLEFADAYNAAYNFEQTGLKQESVAYFQRAYDVYPTDLEGEGELLTKEKLKEHIDELKNNKQ